VIHLARIDQVKSLIAFSPDDPSVDGLLYALIEEVSKAMQDYLCRWIQRDTYTEYFSVQYNRTIYQLSAYPVSSISSVHNATDWDWDTESEVDDDCYTVDTEAGLLYIERWTLVSGYRALRVIYSGGMAADTEELIASYPDLSMACARQVGYLWQMRTKPGAASVSSGQGTVSRNVDGYWLPEVKPVLDRYRCRRVTE